MAQRGGKRGEGGPGQGMGEKKTRDWSLVSIFWKGRGGRLASEKKEKGKGGGI